MTAMIINGRQWTLAESIGSGGFGHVHVAHSNGHERVIKLVPKDPGAQRELLLADDVRGLPNIVPVLDSGETGDSWALVMPRAEKSLKQYVAESGPRIDAATSLHILIDIARALTGLAGRNIVHRDLKPDNVLLLNGAWCLSDFGISRYAEATTAADTRKYSMTRPYAAPEQWREERATPATDVYAFGVVAFELVMGARPFRGPDFRHQHLHQDLPAMPTVAPWLAELVADCLVKAPGARPSAQRLLTLLERRATATPPATGGLAALQEASRAAAIERAKRSRQESETVTEAERRRELFDAAKRSFSRIAAELHDSIVSVAPSAVSLDPMEEFGRTIAGAASLELILGGSSLVLSGLFPGKDRLPTGPDVIAHATISVTMRNVVSPGFGPQNCIGRAHSLWYCNALEQGQYQWFETAFRRTSSHLEMNEGDGRMYDRRSMTVGIYLPFAVAPEQEVARVSLGPQPGSHRVAWAFTPLRPGDLNDFIDRWATWFAAGSQGSLKPPVK